MAESIFTTKVKYNLGQMYKFVDLINKIHYVKVLAMGDYVIARNHGNVDLDAHNYGVQIAKNKDIFYICEYINLFNDPNFVPGRIVLWDTVIRHDETRKIFQQTVLQVIVVPDTTANSLVNSREDVLNQVIETLKTVSGITCKVTDITDVTEDELTKMTKLVSLSYGLLNDVKASAEIIKPLADSLKGKDFNKISTEVTSYLDSIQARISISESYSGGGI